MPVPGHVTKIRLNPTQELGIVDLCKHVGIDVSGRLPWARCVKLAVGAMLEAMWQNGIIPRPVGYEYEEKVIKPFYEFETHATRGSKLKMADAQWGQLDRNEEARVPIASNMQQPLHVRQALTRIRELAAREHAGLNDAEDRAEMHKLQEAYVQFLE